MRKTLLMMAAIAILAFPAIVMADSIDPATFMATLPVGGSTTITKTVTIDELPPVDAPVDVFFLSDTTGSMGGYITAVRDGASDILDDTGGLGDVWYGVGEYKDHPEPPLGELTDYAYMLNQPITDDTVAVQAGIDMWGADGGWDWEESQLFALNEVATRADTGWRPNSTRVLVWFGDAPGHDPSGGVYESDAITALQTMSISVEAIDLYGLDATGQATAITDATGGHLYSGVATTEIVDVITDAITTAIIEYGEVTLEAEGLDLVAMTVSPGSHSGLYDRSIVRTFEFDVTFTCLGPGVDDFKVHALVDGGLVATETDTITQTDVSVPEPSTILLLMAGIPGLAIFGRKRIMRGKRS